MSDEYEQRKKPMANDTDKPKIFHILNDEATEIKSSPFGSVGSLFSGEGIEAVWVKKQAEVIDPGWFAQPMVDLILVVQGKLKFEFERDDIDSCVLELGDMLVLPANTRCRAYHWPREAEHATVFVAVYPVGTIGQTAQGNHSA